jgi:hypothetical protein
MSSYRHPPFEYVLTDAELAKLGEMSLTWAHTEHLIGNCLKKLLAMSDEQASAMVFPLSLEQRIQRLVTLSETESITEIAKAAIWELKAILPAIQMVRNNVVHGVLIRDVNEGNLFHLRSKDRTLTQKNIFEAEEITNFFGEIALTLRYALGVEGSDWRRPLPDRPEIPEFLRNHIPTQKK